MVDIAAKATITSVEINNKLYLTRFKQKWKLGLVSIIDGEIPEP